jgi:Rps23 Pro-64 3,4-dihydroxylase Tpa1-like proline 4-hydroxylase
MKHYKTTTDDNIFVYDNVFSFEQCVSFKEFAEKSNYSLGSKTSSVMENGNDTFFQSTFEPQDIEHFGIFENISNDIAIQLNGKELNRCWFLASTHFTKYYFHTDRVKKHNALSFIYYVNLKWDKNWGGETLFCNTNGEVEIALEYKPNRVIIFDSHIPHKPSPISADANPYRFTFVAQFDQFK